MTEPKTLVLVDGHALAYRAFHALKEQGLRTSSGEPTYAVFGFCQILLTALHELRPDAVAVCFDVGRTFRHDQYADYKANRAETPAEFHTQLQRIKEVLEALNIPIYSLPGYEADDVIGTLATQAARHGVHTVILTGDTDTLQLVNDHVHVLMANPYRGRSETIRYDVDKVRERYKGLEPAQLADLRGLRGDVTDNIPGVKGIGEAGAIQLLSQFGSVEGIYEHLDEVPNRYRKHLEGQQEQARFSRQLAVIECDVPVQLELERARLSDYERELVVRIFQQLEFRSLLKKLPASSRGFGIDEAVEVPGSSSAPQQLSMFDPGEVPQLRPAPLVQGAIVALGDYRAVSDEQALDELVRRLVAAPGFAFDTEGTGLDPRQAELCGIAIAVEPGSGWYVPVGHRTAEEQLPLELVLHRLRPFFSDPNKQRIAHNAKFDIEMLDQVGMPVPSISFDTMIAAALLGRQSLGLKDLAFNELSIEMTNIEELIGRGKTQTTMDLVPVERVTPYACADVDMTLRLAQRYEAELADQPRVAQIFRRMELPLVPVLVAMEQAGIRLDVPYLQRFGQQLGERLADIEQQIYQLAEYPFNINSGQQLADVLFGKLGLDPAGLERTKTGRYSLTAAALETMRDAHPIIKLILEHRQLTKLKSTYVDALPALLNPQTGRVHTSFNQVGAATGRLSSNNPNLQNIPIRSDVGREIRRAFLAAPGHHLLSADYSQVELRVLAHVTQDPNLIEAFRQDMDIHAATAARLFGVEPRQVDKNQRRIAKTIVFGVIYGISSFGLAPRIERSRAEAQALIDALFAQFPGIRDYINATLEEARDRGYVHTLFGRRRYFPELKGGGGGPRKQAAEREAINAPIQGTSADLVKLAMVRLYNELRERRLRSRILLQVHDELLLEVPEEELQPVQALVREVMEQVYPDLRVPLKVDIEHGPSWAEMEEVAGTDG